jgi:AI-2 transport protein TqsA
MKQTDLKTFTAFNLVMIIAGLVVIIAGMMYAKAVLIPLMMAVFIAIVCSGPVSWFRDKGVPAGLALFIVLTLLCVLGSLAAVVVGTSVNDFIQNLPENESKKHQQMEQFYIFLSSKGLDLKGKGLTDILKPEAALKYAGQMFSELSSLLANVFIVFLMVVFMSLEAVGLPAKLRAVYGSNDNNFHPLQKFTDSVKHYMFIKSIVSAVTGALVALCLWVIGVDYPLMWGMLAFAFNFIPTIGSIIAAVPPVLLALVQLGPGSALAVAVCYILLNLTIGNVVEPRFMGKGLGLSTMVVFFSLLFWGWVFGPIGMLLSVVLTIKIKIMLESSEETKKWALLLGPNPKD